MRATRSGIRAAVALAVMMAALAPPARGSCGGENHSRANPRVVHARGHRAAIVIGDSTMIYAGPRLAARGLEAYARGCRQFPAGLALARARRRAGRLPHLVIFALGANAGATTADLTRALRLVGPRRVLGLVTPRDYAPAAAAMRAFARSHADRVLLVDWRARSAGHPGWFFSDGLHVNLRGAAAFTRLVAGRAAGVIAPPVGQLRRAASPTAPPRDCGLQPRAGLTLRVLVLRARRPLTCRAARHLAGAPPLTGFRRWRWYDWTPTGVRSWHDLYVRDHHRTVVATRVVRGATPSRRPS
jgi:hypothetical protein